MTPSNALAVYTPERQREVATLLGLSGPPNQIALLFQLAEHYNLDPLTKEISLIPGKGPYVGVWGRVHVAQRSGLLDGMEMDTEEEDDRFYKVRVVVWRKDMSHPAAKVIGRVGKTEKKDWPFEIARARALRAALGFAFSIHDVYDTQDADNWAPPPDERIQATVIDVPEAVSREEAPAQPAAKPKTRATKATRGSVAAPDPTPGHTGVGGEPPPAAGPQPSGVASAVGGPDPAATPDTEPATVVVGGHTLAQKLAIAARAAGIDDDQTRHDVITAATGAAATRGQEVTDHQAPRVLQAFAGLTDGTVELRYKPDGTPHLIKPRRP